MTTHHVPVSPDRTVTVEGPFPVSLPEFERLLRWLEAMRRELVDATYAIDLGPEPGPIDPDGPEDGVPA